MVRILTVAVLVAFSGVALAGGETRYYLENGEVTAVGGTTGVVVPRTEVFRDGNTVIVHDIADPLPPDVRLSSPALKSGWTCDENGCRRVSFTPAQTATATSSATYTESVALTGGGFHPLQRLASLFQNRPKLFARRGICNCGQ